MKFLLKTVLFVLLPFIINAQQQQKQLDSLHTALKNATDDTARMLIRQSLGYYYMESNRDSAMLYIEEAYAIAKKINQPIWVAQILLDKSYLMQKQVNLSLSIKLCNEAMAILQNERNEKNAYIPKDAEFANNSSKFRKSFLLEVYHQLGNTWSDAGNKEKGIEYYQKEIRLSEELNSKSGLVISNMNIGHIYADLNKQDSAFVYSRRALENVRLTEWKAYEGFIILDIGQLYMKRGLLDSAKYYFYKALKINREQNNLAGEDPSNRLLSELYEKQGRPDSAFYFASAALQLAYKLKSAPDLAASSNQLAKAWKLLGNADSAFYYLSLSKNISDSLHKDYTGKLTRFQNSNFEEQLHLEKQAQESIAAKNKIRTIALLVGLGMLSILAFVFYRNNKQKHKANLVLEKTLSELKSTQKQLIQSEKMASLGELTAGIAHEIQNPLNFVNNFSEVNKEMLEELNAEMQKPINERDNNLQNDLIKDVLENSVKINQHGKRADAIVKGMLQHSRTSSGQKEMTNINAICNEYLKLSYHGMRAKDKSFNAEMKTDFDTSFPKINVIPQDIGRVILNLINNAFYAVNERKKLNESGYEPIIWVSTKRVNDKIEISVKDNGNGIPDKIKEKIFQPFFTTKPTGSGTGLGLSLSYDIAKAHGGEITVESKENEGTEFVIQLNLK
ncbi:MAG: GHKL domain-containing protein [Bacteroidetes bacterium]|nr:GHKL domain-containing protein [Bacteroidota bacterium]